MKIIKKITAAITAMAMAASMMSIGASADSLNWSVTNVNSHYLYNQVMTANGYIKYRLNCNSFIGTSYPDTYVLHYPYYVTAENGVNVSYQCAPELSVYFDFSNFTICTYYSSYVPPYGTQVHEVFRLYQPTSSTITKSASGVVQTASENQV